MVTENSLKLVDEWLIDENGNRASIERWGSEEEAARSLDTLKNCFDCSDCFRCSGCKGCFDCSDCSDCKGCSDCSRCFDCKGCSDCSRCSRCFDCSGCEDNKGQVKLTIPSIKNIHQKVLEAVSKEGALDMSKWHTCETTRCRAGWVVDLAGEAGSKLEEQTSTEFAAKLIYKKSSEIHVPPTRFYDSHKEAMKDIERCAELEKRGEK